MESLHTVILVLPDQPTVGEAGGRDAKAACERAGAGLDSAWARLKAAKL